MLRLLIIACTLLAVGPVAVVVMRKIARALPPKKPGAEALLSSADTRYREAQLRLEAAKKDLVAAEMEKKAEEYEENANKKRTETK